MLTLPMRHNNFHHAATAPLLLILLFSVGMSVSGQTTADREFPYLLRKNDLMLSLASAGVLITTMALQLQLPALSPLQRTTYRAGAINPFDRSATTRWSPASGQASNLLLYALLVSPAAVALPLLENHQTTKTSTLLGMYCESTLLTTTLVNIMKVTITRKRPYVYNPSLPDDEYRKLLGSPDARYSFFSNHTALAFGSACFLSSTVTDLYGPSGVTRTLWSTSLAVATTIGYLRYASGEHFPSDILVGAGVGSLIGTITPLLHKKGALTTTLVPTPHGIAVAINY